MSKLLIWTILFLIVLLSACQASTDGNGGSTPTDGQRSELKDRKVSDKVIAQLDRATQIVEENRQNAKILTDSAMSAAKALNSNALLMRAYLLYGRISQLSGARVRSEAYYDSAFTAAVTTGDNWYKGEILFHKGEIKHSVGEDIRALEYFNDALQACRLSNNYRIMGFTFSLMGIIFRVNGLYDRAIEYTINSKLNYEKAGFFEGKAWATYLLGRIYSDLKFPRKGLEYFNEALEMYAKQDSNARRQIGLAICYEQIGLLNLELGNLQEARKFTDYTLKIYTDNKSAYGLSNSHKNLGMIEYNLGNYDLAEKYLNESLKAKKVANDLLGIPTLYEYLGLCLIKKNQIREGFSSLQQGLDMAVSNDQKKIQLNIYAKLTETYLSLHDLPNAINCQKKQIEIQDGLLSGAANTKVEQLQAIYEIDKKNGQISELEKQNEIDALTIRQSRTSQLILFIGIFVVVVISLTIYWFDRKIRHKNLELKETNAAKDKFFAIIAHDLRGPAGILTSYMEHLNDAFDEYSPEELRKTMLMLYKSAENVSGLLENLLIWAQSQLNKIEFRPTVLKLDDVLLSSVKGLKQVADNKQIDIRIEQTDQVFVLADPDMLQIIVRNILSNAIKYTHRGGLVIVRSAVRETGSVLISIIDNGVGIEKSALDTIFEIANKVHTKGTEDEKSTGLGLMLVKDFIEKNGGTIAIESQIDEGTTVSFTLSATQPPAGTDL